MTHMTFFIDGTINQDDSQVAMNNLICALKEIGCDIVHIRVDSMSEARGRHG